ncbi:MAG: Mu transposase domain-containing protein [Lachnospirales bacterium]
MSHDRQTTVRKDSIMTYMSNKYSVPSEYIGKPVSIRIIEDNLQTFM